MNFNGLCLADTPNVVDIGKERDFTEASGVKHADRITTVDFQSAYPGGNNVAATFDRTLAYARGAAQAQEMLLHGGDIFPRPVISPLGTFPEGGRNWESFGPDPYLNGELVGPTIEGIQNQGIVATAKHYIMNEQEHFRYTMESDENGFNITESISANVDDRTMHELYLW